LTDDELLYESITPTTLLQFNATVLVGIFLFLTLGVSDAPAILILTIMFPFVISAALILVYETRKSKGEYDGKTSRLSNLHFDGLLLG
jgi:ABC-type transport system involved in cytochrome bd biosynthesis fused ATPase/permease subunit